LTPGLPPDWHREGFRYYSRSFYCRKKFGRRVWKVSVDGGFACPNRDGTLGTGGCIFCDPASFSPSRRGQPGTGTSLHSVDKMGTDASLHSEPVPFLSPAPVCSPDSITAQLDEGIRRVRSRHKAESFVAYFQPATNTYVAGTPDARRSAVLRPLYEEALAHPSVVGLAIGTRPDCVPDEVLNLLAELSARTWLTVEYGLQTIHDGSLDWLNRGHHYGAFLDAFERSRLRELEVGVHVILGVPRETRDDMRATARELARLRVDSVKLHNLYAVRGTRLAGMVTAGEVRLPSLDEYVAYVVDFLELLPPTCVIDRLSGDAPREYLVAPAWCLDKSAVQAAIRAEFERRGSWQGKTLS
jgi:uncharacterized protein